MPNLYVVGTPIGNLEDISIRSLRILKEVSLIAAEDTRTTRKLLTYYDIHTRITSYHDNNASQKLPGLLSTLNQFDVALVTEAGMPGISDPGKSLVGAAVANGIPVVAIPGPSAITAALSVSGLLVQGFVFIGFLPRKGTQRKIALSSITAENKPIVLFESPRRLNGTLSDLLGTLGNREISICRELTKLHEQIFHGTISKAMEEFTAPRGEFTLVISGALHQTKKAELDNEWVLQELLRLRNQGRSPRETVDLLSIATNLPRRQIYRFWLESTDNPEGTPPHES